MKRFVIICVALLLLAPLFAALPSFAENDVYAAARDGDLLYTVNFNGDDNFKPAVTKGAMQITVDSFDSNKATFETTVNSAQAWWGGTIDFLPLNETTLYTVYWTVTREGKYAIGFYPDGYFGVYGYPEKIKLMETSRSLTGHDYATFESQGINVDYNVQRYALEVNGVNSILSLYVYDETTAQYVLFDETEQENEIFGFMTDNLGIYFYTYYTGHVTTVSDCYVNKGLAFGTVKEKITEEETTKAQTPEATTAEQTTAEATTAEATAAEPENTTAAAPAVTTAAEPAKKGCGSFTAAILPVAVCAGFCLTRKNKKD